MKIIQVVNALKLRAGAEIFTIDLSICMKEKYNADITILCLYGDMDLSLVNYANSHGISVICLNKNRTFDFKCFRKFRNYIISNKPDVVNLHNSCLTSYFFAFGFKKQDFKLVKSVHSLCLNDLRGGDRFFQKKYIRKNIITLACDSDEVRKSVIEYYKKMNVAVNPITCRVGTSMKRVSSPRTAPINPDLNFVCVARFYPVKNQIILAKAFKKYHSLYSNSRLTFVGDGPELLNCNDYINQSKIDDAVTFAGVQTNVKKFLDSSDVFVLPSLYEGLGMCVLEAFARGLPAIVSNVGGLLDIVKNEENGLLFESNNVDSLFHQMIAMHDNKDFYSLFSRKNFLNYADYTIEKCSDEYFAIYFEDGCKS